MSEEPPIQYAPSLDGYLAYQVLGSGPIDLLRIDETTMASIDSISDEQHRERFDHRLASFARVIRFDRRGIGLSDANSETAPLTMEQNAKDAIAILDAAGAERAAVFGAQAAMFLAAQYPDRVTHLVLFNAFARLTQADDYPWGPTQAETDDWSNTVPDPSHSGERFDDAALLVPSLADDPSFRSHWSRSGQRGASPAVARAQMKMVFGSDARSVLPAISAPTLVMMRPGNGLVAREHCRFLAEHISGATYVELPGTDYLFYGDDADATLGEVEEFLTGARSALEVDRILTTVLFSDIVDSTRHTADLGDRKWRERLDAHDEIVRRQLERFRGREINTTGDGFIATFDSPARAIQCGCAIRDAVRSIGNNLRIGLHTGEVELRGSDVAGTAVNIAARVCALAGADEILVSSTVKDLVAGSGIQFTERGTHGLKGVPDEWRIFAVAR